MVSEFSRMVDPRRLAEGPLTLEANAQERAALCERFELIAIDSLTARITLSPERGGTRAQGRLMAEIVQPCAVSAEPLAVSIDEPVDLRFVPSTGARTPDEEVELDAAALDEIEYEGSQFDLGEELAQGLALAIDPYLAGPGAEAARAKAGLLSPEASGPFAALAALKKP